MPRKCCVPLCKSNYKTGPAASVFRFPPDEDELRKWKTAIPRNWESTPITKNTVVCERHWPPGYARYQHRGKDRPVNPPSLFQNVPSSCITKVAAKRPTERVLRENRSILPDQLDEFSSSDALSFAEILNEYSTFVPGVIGFEEETRKSIIIQSTTMDNGIPRFVLEIQESLKFSAYHKGLYCNITTLKRNNIKRISCWSSMQEAVRFLKSLDDIENRKKNVIHEHLHVMALLMVGFVGKIYPVNMITRCFEYFAMSRALYTRLCNDYQLPSVRTLTRITSKFSSIIDTEFISKLFGKLPKLKRKCVILIDEVYVKAALRYHGGSIFGKAANDPTQLARTVLCMMVKCLFGGPSFLAKMIPVCKLDADFQHKEFKPLAESINSEDGGEVIAAILDGNRVNQKFFKMFSTDPERPWFAKDFGFFLLYDYVHLLKCIRNNWLTEKRGELKYTWNGKEMIARWADLVRLYELESNSLVQLSSLNYVAVHPKPVERQRVGFCLRVFSEKTIEAFKTHEGIDKEEVEGTVLFLKLFHEFWKIVNVHQNGADIRLCDDLRAVIKSPTDYRLDYLLKLADMVEKMKKPSSGKRVHCLTPDTSKAFAHTCRGLVDLSRMLLQRDEQEYVMFGDYTTDDLEAEFIGFRQGFGGAHFITAQNIMERVRIDHARLLLQFGVEVPETVAGHKCEVCDREMNESESEIFDGLEALETSLESSVLASLVYIAGYVVRHQKYDDDDDTREYYGKHGTYLKNLNRGGLCIPGDRTVQWVIFSYLLFHSIDENKCCINFLMKVFTQISEQFAFNMSKKHCRTLGNTLLKNSVVLKSPLSQKESSLRVLKLS